jgi:uncharacterized protein (TIGR02271 family)
MVKQTPRKGMQLFDAEGALLGMIAGARGNTIAVGGHHIPKAAIARVAQNRAYLKPGVATGADARAATPAPRRVRAVRRGAGPSGVPPIVPLAPDEEARLVARAGAGSAAEGAVVPLATERLRAETRPVELGEVQVRKSVVAEERSLPVELTYETARVEERAIPDRPATGADLFRAETIVVPLRGEEAVVTKEAVVTGEVVIAKDLVAERRQVIDTVRAERAEVIAREPRRRAPR